MRCACSDAAKNGRAERMIPLDLLRGRAVAIDGYNVLTTVEAALAGGVVLAARDGTYRDIAAMHGSYRKVEETVPALELIGRTLAQCAVERCAWYLDQPVSNSGRLKTIMAESAQRNGWKWDVQIVMNPDAVLCESNDVVASADSVILDACVAWVNLAREVVTRKVPAAWVVHLT
jgi:hypothetical protein